MEKVENTDKIQLSFAALDPYVESNIITPTESEVKGYSIIEWGDGNAYPAYIDSLFTNVPSLRACIMGCADYIAGEDVSINLAEFADKINSNGETIEDVFKQAGQDYAEYGGCALNIIRDRAGRISQIFNINLKNIRSDKHNKEFYYSEDWGKSYGRAKYLTYPAFDPNSNDASSIMFIKNDKYHTYPIPCWAAAAKSCEIEKIISEFHLNELANGFAGSYLISLNNGVPSDEMKKEIEEGFQDKFGGYQNAGRFVIAYNKSKDNEASIQPIPSNDFADRYEALKKNSRQEIFTSFRAHPSLFGISTEGSALNKEDYNQTFKLFNKTMILPAQKVIKRAFEKIFGIQDVISIKQFDIDFTEDNNNETSVE